MKSALIFSSLLLVISTSAMADIVYTVDAHQQTVLKKISKKRFEKITQSTTGMEKVLITLGKQKISESEKELNLSDDQSKLAIEVTGKNIIRIEDVKENINKEVEAVVESSILGNVKSIEVSSKTMDSLYADVYKRMGIDELKNANYNGIVKSKIETTNLSCVAEGDLLKCDQDMKMNFTISGF